MATSSLQVFYFKWTALRNEGKVDLRWFSIRGLYFIGDTNALNRIKINK